MNYAHQLLAMLLITGILACIAWVSPPQKQMNNQVSNASQNVTIAPLASKIDNLLFNPVFFLAKDAEFENIEPENGQRNIEVKKIITINDLPAWVASRNEIENNTLAGNWSANLPIQTLLNPIPVSNKKFVFTFFNNDSLHFNHFFETAISEKVARDLERAENEIQKLAITFTGKNAWVNGNGEPEMNLKKELEAIKKAKLQLIDQKVLIGKNKFEIIHRETDQKNAQIHLFRGAFDEDELQKLKEQVQKELKLINRQFIQKENISVSTAAPITNYKTMVYKMAAPNGSEANQNFSFEYHETPRVKVRINKNIGCPEKIIGIDEEENIILHEPANPPAPPSPEINNKRVIRFEKRYSVIRI